MRLDDAFRLLDLPPDASDDDVKRAWRDLTKVWHPDRFGHDPDLRRKAEERSKEINEAVAAIRDARSRGEGSPRDDGSTDGGEGTGAPWRVRFRGRELRVNDVGEVASLVEQGTVGEGAEVFDPTAGCWAAATWIPELRPAFARRRVRSSRAKALLAAAAAVFLLLRRPTPAGLAIALALLGLSLFYVARMRSAARDAGPASLPGSGS